MGDLSPAGDYGDADRFEEDNGFADIDAFEVKHAGGGAKREVGDSNFSDDEDSDDARP